MWPQMVGLRGMPRASFLFFLFFSPFSFPESSPGVSEVLSFLLGLPSGDVKLLRFVEGFSAKNFKSKIEGKKTECQPENNIFTKNEYAVNDPELITL